MVYLSIFDKIKKEFIPRKFKNFFQLNLEYFNHQKPEYKYITGESLDIDQIYKDKLNDLFFNDINNEKDYEEFRKNFASSVQKVYEFFLRKLFLVY